MEDRRTRPETVPMLWAGVALPPFAWAVNLQVNYVLSVFACSMPWTLSFHLMTLATLSLAAGSGRLAWRSWKHIARLRGDPVAGAGLIGVSSSPCPACCSA